MNAFLLALVSMLLRQAFVAIAGALGLTHLVLPIIEQYLTQYEQLIAAMAIFFVTVIYAGVKKFRDKQVLVTALASRVPMSEAEAKALVLDPDVITPSVTTPRDEVPGLLVGSIRESGDRIVTDQVKADTPAEFRLGGTFDGNKVEGGVSYNRTWSNLWGFSAYAKAYWYDKPIIPTDKSGYVVGFDVVKR